MLIREANITDAPALAKVHIDAWRTTYSNLMPAKFLADLSYEERETKWVKILSNITQDNFTYIAENEIGQIVGFADGGKERTGDRQKITSQFIEIVKNLESQIEKLLTEVESKVYGDIDKQIAAARQQEENAIAASNTWVKQLAEIRQDFESILSYITKATENAVNLVT